MHQRIDHIVKDKQDNIIAIFTGPHLSPSALMPEEKWRTNLLEQQGALAFFYEYTGDACSLGDLQSAVRDAYNEHQGASNNLRLTSISVTTDRGKSTHIEHDSGIYIVREPFPLHAVEYLEELSARKGYIVDGKLESELQAALVFGHKDKCYQYRDKLGVA